MNAGGWDVSVKCPFFCRTEKQKHRIVCDGITKTSRLNLVFLGNDAERTAHLRRYCCRDYKKCPLHHAASERYEEGRED